jgi:drug/metabolite transporter (DMT)-like permease
MTVRKTHLDAVAIAGLLTCCALWGLNQVVIKLTVMQIDPMTLGTLRSAVTALLVLLWCRYRGIALFEPDGTLRGGLLVGAMYAGTAAFTYLSLQYTTASRFGVFVYLSPFVVALGMPLIEKSERLTWAQMCGMLVAFGGIGLAFAESFEGPAPAGQWKGDLMAVATGFFWALTVMTVRASALNHASAEKSLFYQLAGSAPLLALLALPGPGLSGQTWNLPLIGLLAYQCLMVSFVSMLLWYWMMRHYPASQMSAFTLTTPGFGLIAGVLLLGEPLTLRLILALATIAAGLMLINRRVLPPA